MRKLAAFLIVVCLVGLIAVVWKKTKPVGFVLDARFQEFAPEEYRRAVDAAERYELSRRSRDAADQIKGHAETALKHMRGIEMSLPNDDSLHTLLQRNIDNAEKNVFVL